MTRLSAHSASAGQHPTNSELPGSPIGTELSPREAHQALQAGRAILIDVRDPDEHAREHIAGAVSIPLSRFKPTDAAAAARPGQDIIVHCRTGRRSIDALNSSAALVQSGLKVSTLTGGIEAWKREGLPVEVNTRISRVSVMRQVQLVIGIGVLTGSALAWFVDPAFIGLAAFFGAGLIFAGASGTCALASIIGRMPWNKRVAGG